jgi:hypothetical protein
VPALADPPRWSHHWRSGGPMPLALTATKWSHATGGRHYSGSADTQVRSRIRSQCPRWRALLMPGGDRSLSPGTERPNRNPAANGGGSRPNGTSVSTTIGTVVMRTSPARAEPSIARSGRLLRSRRRRSQRASVRTALDAQSPAGERIAGVGRHDGIAVHPSRTATVRFAHSVVLTLFRWAGAVQMSLV